MLAETEKIVIQRSMSMNNLVVASDKLDAATDLYGREVAEVLEVAEQTVRYLACRAVYSEGCELGVDTAEAAIFADDVECVS